MTRETGTVLITGANQGIGYEFTRQYADRGWDVIATHRRDSPPDTLVELQQRYSKLRIETIDVTRMDSIRAAAHLLRDVPLDVLVNNAGWGGNFVGAGQMFGSLDYDELYGVMDSMTAGVMRVTEAFMEHVQAGRKKTVTVITSETGSFAAARSGCTPLGRAYWLGTSKAAINFLFAKLSHQFREDGIIFLMLDPGLVRDLNEEAWMRARGEQVPEFRRLPGMPERVNIDHSIGGMIRVIETATLEHSGLIHGYDGRRMKD